MEGEGLGHTRRTEGGEEEQIRPETRSVSADVDVSLSRSPPYNRRSFTVTNKEQTKRKKNDHDTHAKNNLEVPLWGIVYYVGFLIFRKGLMRRLEKISVSHSGRALVDGRVIVPVCARLRLMLYHVCVCRKV